MKHFYFCFIFFTCIFALGNSADDKAVAPSQPQGKSAVVDETATVANEVEESATKKPKSRQSGRGLKGSKAKSAKSSIRRKASGRTLSKEPESNGTNVTESVEPPPPPPENATNVTEAKETKAEGRTIHGHPIQASSEESDEGDLRKKYEGGKKFLEKSFRKLFLHSSKKNEDSEEEDSGEVVELSEAETELIRDLRKAVAKYKIKEIDSGSCNKKKNKKHRRRAKYFF